MDHNERKAADKVVESLTDGRVLGLALFFALLATFGLSLSPLLGILAGLGTVAAAAAVNAAPTVWRGRTEAVDAGLRPAELTNGTQQAQVVAHITATLSRIRDLRDAPGVADSVKDSAAQAFVAARSALDTANTVATAVDQIDAAIRDLQNVSTSGPSQQRLHARRAGMLARLDRTLGGVLDVYSKLVETNATVNTSSILDPGDQDQLTQIGASLDGLRLIVGELEKDTGDGLPQPNP